MKDGAAFRALIAEIAETLGSADGELALAPQCDALREAIAEVLKTTVPHAS